MEGVFIHLDIHSMIAGGVEFRRPLTWRYMYIHVYVEPAATLVVRYTFMHTHIGSSNFCETILH